MSSEKSFEIMQKTVQDQTREITRLWETLHAAKVELVKLVLLVRAGPRDELERRLRDVLDNVVRQLRP